VKGAAADAPPVGRLQRWWRMLTGTEDSQAAAAAVPPQQAAEQPSGAAATSSTQSGPPPTAVGSATAATRKPGADSSAWSRDEGVGQAGRHGPASSGSKQSQLLSAQSEGSEELRRHMRSKRKESWESSQQYMHQKAAGVMQRQPQEYHRPRQELRTPEQGSPPAHQWGQQVQRLPQWQPSQLQHLPPDADTGRDRAAARSERRRQKRAARQARKVAQQLQVPPVQSVAELLRREGIDVGAYLRLDEPQDKEVLSLPGSRGHTCTATSCC
jgi:hypothetical protein